MQARAIFEAACDVAAETGAARSRGDDPAGRPRARDRPAEGAASRRAAEAVFAENGVTITYPVGTMIELPRAALTAGEIAEAAKFFSFGTNDLDPDDLRHQRATTRRRFLTHYVDKGIFVTIRSSASTSRASAS